MVHGYYSRSPFLDLVDILDFSEHLVRDVVTDFDETLPRVRHLLHFREAWVRIV